MTDKSHLTAITRKCLSRPARYLVDNNLLVGDCLDFGCGRGFDCDELDIFGFDPWYNPIMDYLVPDAWGTIMCNYVFNVIPDELERADMLRELEWLLAPGGIAYISVRNDRKNLNGYTSRGTFQTLVELDLPVIEKNANFIMYKLEKK